MKKVIRLVLAMFVLNVPSISKAMNFSITYKVDSASGISVPFSLAMNGKIEIGDYDKLLSFIRHNPYDTYFSLAVIKIQSNGGDLVEAIKIGGLLKSLRGRVFAEKQCVSACFFILAMASTHSGDTATARSVGVHRPYFDREHFAKLSPSQAEAKYNALEKSAKEILVSAKVPQTLIDKMFSVPSSSVYWLSPEEEAALGTFSPGFEELVNANCQQFETPNNGGQWVECVNKIESRERVEGMSAIMKGIADPKWENLKRFYEKKFASGG
jgi:hypothetical protein